MKKVWCFLLTLVCICLTMCSCGNVSKPAVKSKSFSVKIVYTVNGTQKSYVDTLNIKYKFQLLTDDGWKNQYSVKCENGDDKLVIYDFITNKGMEDFGYKDNMKASVYLDLGDIDQYMLNTADDYSKYTSFPDFTVLLNYDDIGESYITMSSDAFYDAYGINLSLDSVKIDEIDT